jgi:hypothetical protein
MWKNITTNELIDENPYSLIVSGNATYEAQFDAETFSVMVDQKLNDNSTQIGTIGKWSGSTFPATRLNPGETFIVTKGTTEVLQGEQVVYNGQKYQNWNNFPDVTNHHTFYIDGNTNRFTSNFDYINNATIQAKLIDGGDPGGFVEFKDPWLIDYADPLYGNNLRNQGMSAPFKSVTSANGNLGLGTVYKGVFLDQGGIPPNLTPPYYTLRAPQTQNFGGVIGYFGYWSATGAKLKDSTKPETPVVFRNADDVVTACYTSIEPFATGIGPTALATGNLNGDTKGDLVTSNYQDGTVSVLVNTTSPGSVYPSYSDHKDFYAGLHPTSVAVGDLNDDGLDDIVVGFEYGVSVLLNTTTGGTINFTQARSLETDILANDVAVGDINNDGKPDIVMVNTSSSLIAAFLNTIDYSQKYQPSFSYPINVSASVLFPNHVALAHINDDFHLDIVVTNYQGVEVLINTNPSVPSFSEPYVIQTGSHPRSLFVTGDYLNTILVTANDIDKNVTLLHNTTQPGSATPTMWRQDVNVGFTPRAAVLGYVDNDNAKDLLVSNFDASTVTAFTGSSSFTTVGSTFFTGFAPYYLISNDMNNDQKADVVIANYGSNTVSVLIDRFGQSTSLSLTKGWNLVSCPRVQTSYAATSVFPGALGALFKYDPNIGDYAEAPDVPLGMGVWVYYQNPTTISVAGPAPAPIVISCKKGWNMIGSRETPVAPGSLTVDAGMILGSLFKYDPGIGDYAEITGNLEPGIGAWVYVTANCNLTIP